MRVFPLLALVLLAPLAHAKTLTVDADDLPYPLKPLAETGRAAVRVTAPCGAPVTLTAEATQEWMRASVEPATLASPACEGSWTGNATLLVTFEAQAPALETMPVLVRARSGNESASAEVAATPAFVGLLDVQANSTQATAKPQEAVAFEVAITNLGNAHTKVSFAIAQRAPTLNLPEPPSIVLKPGQRAQVPIVAQTSAQNGANDRTESFTVLLTSAHALHPDQEGDSQAVSFTVHTQGMYVPAVPAWVALACAALVTLRRARP